MVNACVKGSMQSPIDIKSKHSVKCGALCDLIFYYRTSKCNLLNTKKNIIMDYDNGSYILYNSEVFELDKISFSIPASHKIDGYSFPIEAQLYHRSPDTGGIVILSVFIDVNDATSRSNMFFELFANMLPKTASKQVNINTPDNWNIFDIVPETKSFFTYKGSLPRSPCSENVTWIIMDSSVNCSTNFYDIIKKILPQNARSIQKLNGRKVYYNSNTADKNKRNYGDKMRCYDDKQFRKSCAKLTSQKDIISAQNKNVMLITITACIFITMVLFILWLIQQDFFSKTTEKVKSFLNAKVFIPKK
tara:strand:+ start:3417 stop:4328 length:912 start_codon:yes stop_codon:yes gene_type:complete